MQGHRNTESAAPPQPLRVLLLGSDRVAATLAARLIERLGHPPVLQAATVDAAVPQLGHCEVLLFDADTIDAAALLAQLPTGLRPRVLSMSAGNDAHLPGIDASLRKPLQSQALADALHSSAAGSALDAQQDTWDELLQLFGRDGLIEMIAVLRGDLAKQTQRIDEALQRHDGGALRRSAHSLRGVGLQFGVTGFVDLCARIEQSEDPAAQPALSIAMRDAYSALVLSMEARLHGR